MSQYPRISQEEMSRIRLEAMDFAGIGLYRYRFDGIVVFIDHGALKILDLEDRYPDLEKVAGMSIEDLIQYEGPSGLLRQKIRAEGHLRNFVYPFRTLTGKLRYALHDSYLSRDPETGEDVVQVIIRDITPMCEMEKALAAERERLAVTLRSIGDGVIATDVTGKIVLINREAERLTGWTQKEAEGLPLPQVFEIVNEKTREPVVNPVEKVLDLGIVVGLANHTLLISRDGTERAIADSGAPVFDHKDNIIGVVLVFRDVEQDRRVEETRRLTEHLESIGILAGGIAHDFNNYLTAILGNIALAKSELKEHFSEGEVVEMLEDAEQCSMLARGLTEQLLTFAKGGAPVKRLVALPELLKHCTNFVLSGSSVRLELAVAQDLWAIEADLGQMNQVVNNIVLNARQAMPGGGVLEISADNFVAGPEKAFGLAPGRYVCVSFQDHGIGIDPRHLPKIFDPYFTTKHGGSGLGLTSVFSIVNRHNGHIQVESRLGEGSRFTVHLPARAETVPNGEDGNMRKSKGGRVLLMDDKDFILSTCSRMLTTLGYEVECAKNGEEAVLLYEQRRATGLGFDVVILDLSVPGGMGGVEALATIRAKDPQVVAIASSGYSHSPVMSDYETYGFKGIIVKPYTRKSVADVLASVLPGTDM